MLGSQDLLEGRCGFRGKRFGSLRGVCVGSAFASWLVLGCSPPEPLGAPAKSPESATEAARNDPAPEANQATPPDFELRSLSGGSVRLRDHLGSDVVLLDFWATYCDPCLMAMPHLEELYNNHKADGFVILGISIDGPESTAQVRTEVHKLGVSFPILLDTESEVAALYNPKSSAPYSVLISKKGRVLRKFEGYTPGNSRQLELDVRQALGN